MKKHYLLVYAVLALAGASLAESCKKHGDEPQPEKECTKTTITNSRSVNLFDLRTSSVFYNQVVANFKFVQASNTYKGTSNCPFMDCSTVLVIQNVTPKTITLDFNVIFQLNLAQWNYQGVTTIAPNATAEIGQVSSNCGSINLGSFVIQSASINYR